LKRIILFATVAAMFCYPGVAVAFPEQEARCEEVPGLDVNQCTGGGRNISWSELPPGEITWGGGGGVHIVSEGGGTEPYVPVSYNVGGGMGGYDGTDTGGSGSGSHCVYDPEDTTAAPECVGGSGGGGLWTK